MNDASEIHRTLMRLRTQTALPLTFGGPVNARRQVLLTEFAGANSGALRGVVLEPGLGLGGKVTALQRPAVVNDYVATASISHHYDRFINAEGLRAMVAVPVVVRNTVRGVVYGALRAAVPLGDRIVGSVVAAARDLEQTLAVQDETRRRMTWLQEQGAGTVPGEASGAQWERVREAYAELRVALKDIDDADLRERMDAICSKLAAVCAPAAAPGEHAPKLSVRELDVLACVALGWSNADIAADLGLHRETVKSYLRSAMNKLSSRTRLEAVVAARRHGLLP